MVRKILFALLVASFAGVSVADDPTVSQIPLRTGLRLISVLHFPTGDRENVVTVERATPDAVTYAWHAVNVDAGKRLEADFNRTVLTTDLANATRLHTVFRSRDQTDYPGYTAFSISKAVYESVRTTGSTPFTIAQLDSESSVAGIFDVF